MDLVVFIGNQGSIRQSLHVPSLYLSAEKEDRRYKLNSGLHVPFQCTLYACRTVRYCFTCLRLEIAK